MKKMLSVALILALALALAVARAEAPETLPDFTVTTVDGESASLYAILREKDVVLVNIFTSWCPPCRFEFPMIQALYARYGDRLGVIAVSDEPTDTLEVLDDYRAELGLTFPMGLIEGTGLDEAVSIQGYPTSLFVTEGGDVAYFQLGAFQAESHLEAIATRLLAEDYDGSPFTFYGVYCCDENENPIEGVVVSFCSDTVCEPLTSDENGLICYFASPGEYHLQVLKAPEGYAADPDSDIVTDLAGGCWLYLVLRGE